MSDDIHRKRDYVLSLYSGPRWREKVSKMSDAQVVAIYLREHSKPTAEHDKPLHEAPQLQAKQESEADDIPF